MDTYGRGMLAAGVLMVVGAVMLLVGGTTLVSALGWYLVSSVAICAAIVSTRMERALVVAVIVGLIFLVGDAAMRRDTEPYHQRHDGGVVATEAAARMVVGGINPYAADFTSDLEPHHHTLEAIDNPIPNPLIDHYPYLPLSFLTQAPLAVAGDALGDWYDARLLYVLIAAVAVYVIASGTPPAYRRGAAVWALVGSGTVAVFLSWGTNDTAAASLLVIGAFLVDRRPVLAGVLIACAISLKALLVVALIPLLALWLIRDRAQLRPLLTALIATGLVSSLPYLIASPRDFVDDAILFNLGLTDQVFPVSGFGLAKHFPDLVNGWVLFTLSAVLVAGASVAAVWWIRRCPEPEVALFAAGVIVLAGLIPARTFQQTYAPLMVILWAPIWRLPAAAVWPPGRWPLRAVQPSSQ